jgi:hypothetical protein
VRCLLHAYEHDVLGEVYMSTFTVRNSLVVALVIMVCSYVLGLRHELMAPLMGFVAGLLFRGVQGGA